MQADGCAQDTFTYYRSVATRITEVTVVQAVPPMFAPGAVLLGRYHIEAEIGVGGCSLVLRARDHALDQPVAIKILRTDVGFARDMETRLMREARAIAQLTSEHVVRIFDVGTLESGAPFLVMELLHGADLGALLARQRPLAPAIAVDFILQACDALAEAHARGIVHRDIKPSNLFLVARPDGSEVVKILDFGISKSPVPDGDLSLTQTASLLGTPAYMAPEQMRSARSADARSDVWALGTVLYELVEGQLPITADSFAELVVAASILPHRPMTVAPQLSPVIARCLAKTPDERYANVAELTADLARFTAGPIGLACVSRTARVLGVAPRVHGAVSASSNAVLPRPMSVRRIATIALVTAAIAIPIVMLAARARDRAPPVHVESPPVAPLTIAPSPAAPSLTTPPPPPTAQQPAPPPIAQQPAGSPPAPPPAVHTGPPSAAAAAAPPAKPPVHRRPKTAGSAAGCDPYSRPEGC
jgi:serine/threonine-protein kinase